MSQTILDLARVISDSVANISKICDANGTHFPSPNEPAQAAYPTQPELVANASQILAAARQLIMIFNPTDLALFDIADGPQRGAALAVALRLHIAERLREGDPEGVDVADIASHCNVDRGKLARILRLLVSNGVFREPRPDVFANNRLSIGLDSGKAVQLLMSKPQFKHDNSNVGFVSRWLDIMTDETAKAAAYLPDAIIDNSNKTAHQLAFRTDLDYVDWLSQDGPDQLHRRRRQLSWAPTPSMAGGLFAPGVELFTHALDDAALPPDGIVVGVGLGSTQAIVEIAKVHPSLQYVIQDATNLNSGGSLEELAKFTGTDESALASGQIRFQAHKIYDPQPVKHVPLFIYSDLSFLHLPKKKFSQTLTELRKAASNEGILLLSVAVTPDSLDRIPKNLLGNDVGPSLVDFGGLATQGDMLMMAMWNSELLSFEKFNELLSNSGWQTTKVFRTPSPFSVIRASCA